MFCHNGMSPFVEVFFPFVKLLNINEQNAMKHVKNKSFCKHVFKNPSTKVK